MKLFLDDVRDPSHCLGYMHIRIGVDNLLYKEGWYVVRNYDDFVQAIQKHYLEITHCSLDHDLAEEHYNEAMDDSIEAYERALQGCKDKTGYECALWMKQFYDERKIEYPVMFIHSMNPVGVERIKSVFKK